MKKSIVFKPIYLLWLGCLLPLFGACQKEYLPNEVKTVEDAYRMIVGEWEWERTEILHRGQENYIYETPDTENKTIRRTFTKNLKSRLVETIDHLSTGTDYEYNITIETPASDGYGGTFFLTSNNTNTEEKHLSIFRFENKNTLVFFLRSPSVISYYSRK